LERWRKPLRKAGEDPFGDEPSSEISRKKLDSLLAQGDPEAAGVVQGAIEDFAQELALVIRRFLKLKAWRNTERIAVGGGFRASRVGELTIGRAAVILKSDKVPIDLVPIRNDFIGMSPQLELPDRRLGEVARLFQIELHDAGTDIGAADVDAD